MFFSKPSEGEPSQSPPERRIQAILNSNLGLAKIFQERVAEEIVPNERGEIVRDGHGYADSPLMRDFISLADAIRKSLPVVPADHVRLWRGNRREEVGRNPSYTNSLDGIALPFLAAYGGVLSYVDVPLEFATKSLVSGAKDSEFILPSDIVRIARIVGVSEEESERLKQDAKADEPPSDDWSTVRT